MNTRSILLGAMVTLLAIAMFLISTAAVFALPITITEQQQMNFGKTFAGANTCYVDFSGVVTGDCTGPGSQALILISGDPNTSVNVSVSSLGWIGDIKVSPETQRKVSYVTNGAGNLVFPVAGRVQLRSNPGSGLKILQYIITVNYQ